MAEESGELKKIDRLDPVSTTAGSGRDEFLERYSEDLSSTERREFDVTGDAPEETEQIKARIEETRKEMGETIDAIQERLSFANISEQVSETVNNAIETAKDTAYDATIGKAVNFMKNVGDEVKHSGAYRTVRDNPVPLALIGLGTGLLVYSAYSGRSRSGDGRARRNYYDDTTGEKAKWSLSETGASIGDATSRAYDGVADRANTALEGVTQAAGSAYERVSETMSNVRSRADEVAHRAYERAEEYGQLAHEKYDQYLEENPLALGAIAVALGAAVGFAIPSTEYEGKLMGDTRDQLMHRAQNAADSLIERAKNVAAETGETIKEEARSLTE